MDPMDAYKTTFMSNPGNYYCNVMPFSLKKVGATYHRLMDAIFVHKIRRNLEVYVDDMIMKMVEGHSHEDNLKDILKLVRRYDMHLNPTKWSFGVQKRKFMGLMLTRRWIKANPNKFHAVIDLRSPTNEKEVQQLTGRLSSLCHFLSYMGDKAFNFFATLRKKGKFEWTFEYDDSFSKVKEFLKSPPILTLPKDDSHFFSSTSRSPSGRWV